MEINSSYLFSLVAKALLANSGRLSRSRDDVLADIRMIRFNDAGVLQLIDRFIEGEKPNSELVAAVLTEFNDREWHVADAAARLIEEVGPVSRIAKRDLQLIGWRKLSIRRQVQDILNGVGRRGFRTDAEAMKGLRSDIDVLNDNIDRLEDTLMHGRAK